MTTALETFVMTTDELWPRDAQNRYRVYAVVGDERTILCTASTAAGIGLAFVTLHEDQREIGRNLSDLGRIGVLDTMPGGEPHPTGEWIVLPYDRVQA